MASLDRADPVILGHILQEHTELHGLLRSAREAIKPESPPASAACRAAGCQRIASALTALRDHMAEHFHLEETGGFLEECLARLPRLASDVRQVLDEHPGLLSEANRLIQASSRGDIPAAGWSTLCHDVDQFATHLLDHERRENRVMQQGYNEDLGLTDS